MKYISTTAGFTKRVPSVHALLMNTIYLSHSKQVAKGTVFKGLWSGGKNRDERAKKIRLGTIFISFSWSVIVYSGIVIAIAFIYVIAVS